MKKAPAPATTARNRKTSARTEPLLPAGAESRAMDHLVAGAGAPVRRETSTVRCVRLRRSATAGSGRLEQAPQLRGRQDPQEPSLGPERRVRELPLGGLQLQDPLLDRVLGH